MPNLLSNFKITISDKLYLKDPETSILGKKIIKHSIGLIDEIGFEAFTFKKLGTLIKSNESSIYRYFESKHKLLIYLSTYYWSWTEYNLVIATANISQPLEKLLKAIEVVTQIIQDDPKTPHIDESVLSRIVVSEFNKTLFTKEVDKENQEGYFMVYLRIIERITVMIEQVNPEYPFSKTLASSIINGNLHQNFLKDHFTSITNLSQNTPITDFYSEIIVKLLKKK